MGHVQFLLDEMGLDKTGLEEMDDTNKSLVQVLESSPSSDVTLLAVLPTLVPSLMEIQSQLV